ncbi:hypothetical protein JCM10212_007144 [Sporobolomyces blumeae]
MPPPLPAGWVSLAGHRAGTLAVAVAATVSIACVGLLTTFIALLLYRYHTNSAAEKQDQRQTKAIRFLASTHGLLFIDLCLGDLLQAIGFLMNYGWFRRGGLPPPESPTTFCTAQAVLIQMGDVASAFSSLIISVNLFIIVVFSKHPSVKALWLVIALQWIIVGLLAGIGPRWLAIESFPFYAVAGGWCWISAKYQGARLWLHYFFVFLVAFLDLILYTGIAVYLGIQSRRTSHGLPKNISSISGVAKIMPLYALSYIVTILPLSAFRVASMAGTHWSLNVQLAAGTVFTLSGAVNCIIYATTRNIISSESVGAIRRGSHSLTHSGVHASGSKVRNFFFSRRPTFVNSANSGSSFEPSAIRVQVETEIYLPGLNHSPQSLSKGCDGFDEEEGGVGGGGPLATGPRKVKEFDWADRQLERERQRERDRDLEREIEMERDWRQQCEREGDRPFGGLTRVQWTSRPDESTGCSVPHGEEDDRPERRP